MTIGRKQRTRQVDWTGPLHRAYAHPEPERARQLIDRAAHRLDHWMRYLNVRTGHVSWSGGKDSQVAQLVAQHAGHADSGVCVLTAGLEYAAFTSWVAGHVPANVEVRWRQGMDLGWLADHPDWLFPETAGKASRWFRQVQHTGQRQHMALAGEGALIMGRRLADGNYCGDAGCYLDRGGFWRLSPLYDWSHEDVLCILGAYNVALAPCYSWPEGFRVATGPWPKRRRHPDGLAATWAQVAAIDPSVVHRAAGAGILGAPEYLAAHPTDKEIPA